MLLSLLCLLRLLCLLCLLCLLALPLPASPTGRPSKGKDTCQGDSGGPLFKRGKTASEDMQVSRAGHVRTGCVLP